MRGHFAARSGKGVEIVVCPYLLCRSTHSLRIARFLHMDKHTLITIVITVVVTAIIKESVAWIISIFKNAAIIGTAKQKLIRLFTKTNLTIAADLFAIFIYGGVLVHFALDESEPSRVEILISIVSAFIMLFMMFSFLIHVSLAKSEKRKP